MTAQMSILSSASGVAFETASCLWVELVVFALAATSYLIYTGGVKPWHSTSDKATPVVVPPKCGTASKASAAAMSSPKGMPVATKKFKGNGGSAAVSVKQETKAPSCKELRSGTQMAVHAIRALGRARDLQGAIGVLDKLEASGASASVQVHNCLLDVHLQCDDLPGAMQRLREMASKGEVDVVSYNTVLKRVLGLGRTEEAKELLRSMAENGLPASRITFHEILHAKVLSGDHGGMWRVVDEMCVADLAPDVVTCSILVKSLRNGANSKNIDRVMTLVADAEVGGQVDEVLLSSVAEACIRIQRLDMLSQVMRRFEKEGRALKLSAPGYGSLIKAYGQARDVARIWELWREMGRRNVPATEVTMGCMIDALVTNGRVEEALDLVNETNKGPTAIVNTVIYSTILKGFSQDRNIDRIFIVYAEMAKHGIQCNLISYNTMINACARSGSMDRVSGLLKDMRASGLEPDLVTYSTLVKGYSLSNNVSKGFKVLEEMRASAHFKPDEIMCNSLLDGCAREQRVDEALQLIEYMKDAGVAPSNCTLSILLKLLGRTKRLDAAFAAVKELSSQHWFRPNVQVYTCLIQACIHNRRLDRAMVAHDMMVAEPSCRPDEKAYSVLVRGCLQARGLDEALYAVRCAYGLGSPRKSGTVPGVEAGMVADVLAKLRSGSAPQKDAARALATELETRHGLNVDKMSCNPVVPGRAARAAYGGRVQASGRNS